MNIEAEFKRELNLAIAKLKGIYDKSIDDLNKQSLKKDKEVLATLELEIKGASLEDLLTGGMSLYDVIEGLREQGIPKKTFTVAREEEFPNEAKVDEDLDIIRKFTSFAIDTQGTNKFKNSWQPLMLLVEEIFEHSLHGFRTFGMRDGVGKYLTRFENYQLFEGRTLIESVYKAVVDYCRLNPRYD